jgi:MoaA/NifB/PqqE/SkfB family radical SAM enzyme
MFAADMRYAGPVIDPEKAKSIIDQAAELKTFNMIATGSQEFYLDYESFLDVVDYAYQKYSAPLTITTSCYWAHTEEKALKVFSELRERGLMAALISLDRYHLEFVKFQKVVNALRALRELRINTTVQTIVGRNHEGSEHFRRLLGELAEGEWIDFVEHNTTPVGRAANIPDNELNFVDGIPSGDCNIFEVCHVEPDGSVKPCCGGALTVEGLTAGNINEESLQSIAARMNVDPLFNSLRAYEGPSHLYQVLRELEANGFEQPRYTGTCHACGDLFSRPDIVRLLRQTLAVKSIELLAARWYRYDRNMCR